MDVPNHLRTLPPEALDILRFYRSLNARSAHADDIIEGADLSDRGFGKAIRRLVTKNYLVMDGDQVYRLSDMGQRAVDELGSLNLEPSDDSAAAGDDPETEYEPRFVRRHLVLVAPRTLRAGQPTNVFVGFDSADDDEILFSPLEVILRLNVLHGEPDEATETSLVVENRAVHQTFEVMAGNYEQARIRVEVCQFADDLLDPSACGGLYADFPIAVSDSDTSLTAYSADVELREEPPAEDEYLDLEDFDFE